MASIFRFDDSTLYLCDGCLRDLGPIPGKWVEEPLAECSVCGEIDLQTREEMDAWHKGYNIADKLKIDLDEDFLEHL